ncbi:nuclease-related domain-containing protein [Deinococcus apachensis]|uniref:nuclease-related domain-containing protein n=1 Tax=Deinococcus apachensis TaxID=309886 RepID=UPI00036F1A83|nr:nuclease-related domain-containing protein [Deinococcus apachensis]
MIVKELEPQAYPNSFRRAGHEAERQMAHYLKRAFGDDRYKFVLNNLRVEREGEVAQLDHLVVHRHGLIVVESKSVAGQISVNEQGEWTRWWKGQGRGMASPILQARRQLDLLVRLLSDHTEELLDRGVFGLRQRRFDTMRRDVLVAISDGGRITRKGTLAEVVKADQVPDRVREIVGAAGGFGAFAFSDAELTRLTAFLRTRHQPLAAPTAATDDISGVHGPQEESVPAVVSTPGLATPGQVRTAQERQSQACPTPDLGCRTCGSAELTVLYGKYGHYLKCRACGGNTPAKPICPTCGQPGRLHKAGREFTAQCSGGHSWPYFTNPSDT